MAEGRSICVLVSGGLDSDVLLARMVRRYPRVYPLYVRQGLTWESAELYWLRRFLRIFHHPRLQPLRFLSVPMEDLYGAHWSVDGKRVPGGRSPDRAVYLPGRNLVLSVKAAVFCAMRKIPQMAFGSLGHNPFPDASPAFFKQWGQALSQGLNSRMTILAPFRSMTKAEVIQQGRDLPLELSFSCLAPRGRRHCGRCNKCAERRRAFREARVEDRTIYAKS